MKPTITTAEILTELEKAAKLVHSDDDAFTLNELVEATGWGPVQARRRLVAAKKAGRLSVVRVMRENLAGYLQPAPAYRIAPTPKKARK